jgi:prostaglandin reductase 1
MAKRFQGAPKLSDFAIKEEPLPSLKDGEFLCKAEYISVDPYQRAYAGRMPEGWPIIGYQVAEIVESKDKNFPVGKRVVGSFGWRSHTISKAGDESQPYLVPDTAGLPVSAAVGLLGMPGMTAYFGLIECCMPKPGETVVVNGAAGAVGSAVGQLAKIMGCRVIGYAGEDSKLDWLKKECGFDHVFNYKTVDLAKSLKEAAPNGVDCFFDNVGGTFAITVYEHMNRFGRICQCGAIQSYNNTKPTMVPEFLSNFIFKELSLKGFYVDRTFKDWPKAIRYMGEMIKEGKLKFRETIVNDFENTPQALIDLLEGKNTGKMIVKANISQSKL